MFGRSLEETMQVEARLGGAYVPVFVHKCVSFIREHGKLPLWHWGGGRGRGGRDGEMGRR